MQLASAPTMPLESCHIWHGKEDTLRALKANTASGKRGHDATCFHSKIRSNSMTWKA